MKFEDIHVIPGPFLFREANVSVTRGNRIVERLQADEIIFPKETPTGRKIFTPRDGKIVFNALINGV